MSEDDKKDPKPMKILSNYEKELLYQKWKRSNKPLTELAKEEGIKYNTLQAYKRNGKWDERKIQETNEVVALQTKGTNVNLEVGKKAVSSLMKSLLKMAEDFELAIFYQDTDTQRAVPFKTLTECLDKIVRLQHFLINDGTKHNLNMKKEIVDWAAIIKMSIEEKKKNPNFDDQAFAEKVIDAAFTDKKEDE